MVNFQVLQETILNFKLIKSKRLLLLILNFEISKLPIILLKYYEYRETTSEEEDIPVKTANNNKMMGLKVTE